MKKEKIRFFDIYNILSKKEQKEFRQFVSINLFGNSRSYKDFFESLLFDKNGKLKPGSDIKDRSLSNRLTELTKLAQIFLVMKNSDLNKFDFELSLLDELNKRGIDNFFNQKINALEKSISNKPVSKDKLKCLIELNRFKLKINSNGNKAENPHDVFHNKIDLSSVLFAIEFLEYRIWEIIQYQNNSVNARKFSNVLTEQINFEKIISYTKLKIPEFHPLISFYNYMLNAFLNLNDTYNYHIARKIFMSELKNDSKKDNNFFYYYLISYNIIKSYLSPKSTYKELFLLINMKIDSGLYTEEFCNEDNSFFMVSVMTALALKEFEWVGNFIDKYGPLLPENLRDNRIYLSKAYFAFFSKDFKECEKYSEMVSPKNPFFYINSGKLKLQTYYELNKIEECFVVLKRLQEYLRLHKDSTDPLIRSALDFCTVFGILLRLRDNPVQSNYLKIEFAMKEHALDADEWLSDKISEIETTQPV